LPGLWPIKATNRLLQYDAISSFGIKPMSLLLQ